MLSRNVIDSLICSSCNKSLSVFPIYSYGSTDTVVCGRCPIQNELLPQRQDLFEELAQHIEFPCRYQNTGCIEMLKPAQMKDHEAYCPHKRCLCPILPVGTCQWQGDYIELFEHCQCKHPTLSYRDFMIDLNLTHSFENNYVFYQGEETFVAQLKFDVEEEIFYCNVRYCGPACDAKNFCYCACFLSKEMKFSCKVQSVEHGEIGSIHTENTTEVGTLDRVTNLKNAVCYSFKIDIFVRKTPTEEKKTKPLKDNEILKMLKCPICLDYMLPPILQCNLGHSFCESCRNQVATCPTCRGPIEATRNYLLEQFTNVIEYPCKYEKYGCTFSANADQIRNHESNCENGPHKCVMHDCPWESKIYELKEHINICHKDNILETNTVTFNIMDNTKDTYEYIIIQRDDMFKVKFTINNNDFVNEFIWDLQGIGESQDSINKYIFILDFGSETKERLYSQTKCFPHHLTFTNEHMDNFMDDDVVTYKMQIIKDME